MDTSSLSYGFNLPLACDDRTIKKSFTTVDETGPSLFLFLLWNIKTGIRKISLKFLLGTDSSIVFYSIYNLRFAVK
jgi:hypothetical protein